MQFVVSVVRSKRLGITHINCRPRWQHY